MSVAHKFEIEDTGQEETIAEINKRAPSDYSVDKLAGYFYKIANHEELFKVGNGLLVEVGKGVRNFSFTSTGYKNSQQRTILGLCCFFDQHANHKIAIVSDHLAVGVFSDIISSSTLKSYPLSNQEDFVNYKSFHHHFDFIDYSEFIKFYENHEYTKSFDHEITAILEKYDIVLWDIPEMDKLKENPNFHYRISQFYQSMTIIVSQGGSSLKQVDLVKKFFANYNISLNGVLFDTTSIEPKKKRKKFLGIF